MRTAFLLFSLLPSSAFQIDFNGVRESKWVREAEKKHSRVALLALPTLATIASSTDGADPVPFLNSQPATTQLIFYSVAGLVESANLRRLGKGFSLKEGEEPGKLLPIKAGDTLNSLEDAVGRAAMLACTFFLVSSVV